VKDLKETLLHEMIHAALFLGNVRDDGDHGPKFRALMNRINNATCADSQVTPDTVVRPHWGTVAEAACIPCHFEGVSVACVPDNCSVSAAHHSMAQQQVEQRSMLLRWTMKIAWGAVYAVQSCDRAVYAAHVLLMPLCRGACCWMCLLLQRPAGGYNITVCHTMHDEVNNYRTHVWSCTRW
jgi:hypothetical protein